jgi:hypothetical protein
MYSLRLARNSLILTILCVVPCGAQIIRGTVRHGATGRPVPGDQVILLSAGTLEKGRTLSGKDGDFQIEAQPPTSSPEALTVRVIHDGVSYDDPVQSGSDVNVTVFDGSRRVSGLSGYMSILQFQTRGGVLEVMELHAIRNDSKPPMTRVAPDNLELSMPEGSQVRSVTVAGPDNKVLKVSPTLVAGKGTDYEIDFPIKPGLTRYAVTYDLPYSNKVVFRRRGQYRMRQISVLLPKSMGFTSLGPQLFHRTADQQGAQVETLYALGQNEPLAFELSGAGALPQEFRPLDPSARPGPTLDKPTSAMGMALPQRLSAPPAARDAGSGVPDDKSAAHRSPPVSRMITGNLGSWISLGVSIFILGGVILWIMLTRRYGSG